LGAVFSSPAFFWVPRREAPASEERAMSQPCIRPALAIAALVLLAACARTPLGSDLHAAGADCRTQQFSDKAALVACLNQHERPVWAKDDPATLDIYDHFAEQRTALARRYDSGAITEPQYRAELDQLEADSRAALAERRKQTAATP
jgi:hypothetical protein